MQYYNSEGVTEMVVLNFGHPFTTEQQDTVEKIIRQKIARVIDVAIHIDADQPIYPQIEELIDTITDHLDFAVTPYLINLPGLNIANAVLLAVLHGRSGYFPPAIRLRPMKGAHPSKFEVVEIVNLQEIRNQARRQRY